MCAPAGNSLSKKLNIGQAYPIQEWPYSSQSTTTSGFGNRGASPAMSAHWGQNRHRADGPTRLKPVSPIPPQKKGSKRGGRLRRPAASCCASWAIVEYWPRHNPGSKPTAAPLVETGRLLRCTGGQRGRMPMEEN